MTQALQKLNYAEQFIAAFNRGVEAWQEAGDAVAKGIDEEPDFVDQVVSLHPEVSSEMICAFERIGRKKILPRLLVSEGKPGVDRLLKMPLSYQEKYAREPVPVLLQNNGDWQTLLIDVRNLSARQASQAFDKTGVRSAAAQRAYIEDQNARKSRKSMSAQSPYRIVGKKLLIMTPCEMDASQVALILLEMQK